MPRRHRYTPRPTAATAIGALLLTPLLAAAPPAWADDGPVAAGVTVARVDGLRADFVQGVDVSSVLSLEDSGVTFRDAAGRPADLFGVLADADVTHVRVRVWNDPFTAAGDGYGGGDVDVARAVEIGRRATAAGLRVLVDLHYSDFWADPGKQKAPKAWSTLDVTQKAAAVEEFTADSLRAFVAADVDVDMVQVGNETNNAVAGVSGWDDMAQVLAAGSAGVREVLPDALVVLHFTDPQSPGRYAGYAAELDARDVDYDVFASSYYPFWHGTTANLTSVLAHVASTYGKQVMVAETSWVSTLDDGDGHPNVIDQPSQATAYPVSVQGQATAVRDVVAAVAAVGEPGLGVFYWEPAWLPVGPPSALAANRLLWEAHGSGWASSHAGEYDPVDAGQWYGGSAWDNQALFAPDGTPLESLQVFRHARTGAVAPLAPVSVAPVAVTVDDGSPVVLPATVRVSYNDGTTQEQPVVWSDALSWVRGPGTYAITGSTPSGIAATATLVVRDARTNLVVNGDFEDTDRWDVWTVTGTGAQIDWSENATTGGAWIGPDRWAPAVRFWAADDYAFTVQQRVDGVPPGTYTLSAHAHGAGEGTERVLFAATAAGERTAPVELGGFQTVRRATIPDVAVGEDGVVTVGVRLQLTGGAWGALDEFTLTEADAPAPGTGALEALLEQARVVDRRVWTADSLVALDRAVEIGRVVLAGGRATQGDVDAAADLLRDALDELVAQPTPTPTPTGTPAPTTTPAPTAAPTPRPTAAPTATTAPAGPRITVDRASVRPGDTVTVTVTGLALDTVEVGIASAYQRLAVVPVVDGTASVRVTIPASLTPGLHHLQVLDASGAVLAEVAVEVASDGAARLGDTGASVVAGAVLALALLGAGTGAVVVARRRTSGTTAA